MLNFEKFAFGSTLCVGGHAFALAMCEDGIRGDNGRIFDPPAKPGGPYRITIVRHPFSWLSAYYSSSRRVITHIVGVPEIDVFADLYLENKGSFEAFVSAYLEKHPGAIGRMFDAYQSNSMLRYEDMPRVGVEALQTLGYAKTTAVGRLPVPDLEDWRAYRDLRKAVVHAERFFCDRAEYF